MARNNYLEKSCTPGGRLGSRGGFFAAFVSLLFLTACANLKLVEDYDPQIEQSLNEYHKSFLIFVRHMEQSAGTPAGAYGSEDAKAFYAESDGTLGNLIVRAEANNPQGTCQPSGTIAGGISALLDQTVENFQRKGEASGEAAKLGSELSEAVKDFNSGTSELAIGSCTVVVLKALKLNQAILEGIHKRNNMLKPPVSTIGAQLISDGVKMAIITEQSKKP